jgi:hypothetical protein
LELRVTVGIEPEAIASPAETAEGVVGSLTSPSPSATSKESAAPPSGTPNSERPSLGVEKWTEIHSEIPLHGAKFLVLLISRWMKGVLTRPTENGRTRLVIGETEGLNRRQGLLRQSQA